MPKRKSFTASFKLEAIKYAEEHGNRAAARKFDCCEKNVRVWRSTKMELEKIHPRKRARRGGKARLVILYLDSLGKQAVDRDFFSLLLLLPLILLIL